MNLNKHLLVMVMVMAGLGGFAGPQPLRADGVDLTGSYYSSKTGIAVATGSSTLPNCVQSYAPTLAQLYATPSEITGKAVSKDLFAQAVDTLVGLSRGTSASGKKLWTAGLILLFAMMMFGAFITFSKISQGKESFDTAGVSFFVRMAVGLMCFFYLAGFLPNFIIGEINYLNGSTDGTASTVEEAFALKVILTVQAQAGPIANTAAGVVTARSTGSMSDNPDSNSSGSSPKPVDPDALEAKYLAIFLKCFYQIDGSTYGSSETFAKAVVSSAKAGKNTTRPGASGVWDKLKSTAISSLVGGPLFGLSQASDSKPWEQRSLSERRAMITMVVQNSAVTAHRALQYVVKEDLLNLHDGAAITTADYEAIISKAMKATVADIFDQRATLIAHDLGMALPKIEVNRARLESSYNTLDLGLLVAMFEICLGLWLTPLLLAASAIWMQSPSAGLNHFATTCKLVAQLIIMSILVSVMAQKCIDHLCDVVSGSGSSVSTGSWLSWLGNVDVVLIFFVFFMTAACPAIAAAIVWGGAHAASKAMSAMASSGSAGGMGGVNTAGGWMNAAGRTAGIGGSSGSAGGGASVWDKINGTGGGHYDKDPS